MSNLNRHPVRRAAVGVLAGTLAFSGAALGVGISPANAVEGFTFERLAGADRFGTARVIANDTFQTADTVVLASGRPDDPRTARNESNFPDALTGNFLAGAVQGPILLTRPGSLPEATIEALQQLDAENVIIVGGTDAVSAGVEADLERRGLNVERLGGPDRYDTAQRVAEAVAADDPTAVGESGNGLRTAVLGNGQNFPDILAAGPLGYSEQFPITITPNFRSTLDPRTEEVLEDLDIERVLILGETAAVQAGVEAQLRAMGIQTTRLGGVARFETAIEVADFAYDELGFDETHINMARSNEFADALAGGPHAGEERSAIILTDPTVLNRPTRDFLVRQCPVLQNGHIFGGPVAIDSETETEAEEAASNCDAAEEPSPSPSPTEPAPAPNTISVTPDTEDTRTVTANPDTTTTDDRTFQVSGLTSGETFRITLVRCENVRGSGQDATFLASADANSSTGFSADTGSPTADIISVNGVATQDSDTPTAGTQTGTTTFTASGTTASFVVDGDSANECVVPVVYFDSSTANTGEGGNSTRLELNATAAGQFASPAEDFDIGGRTNFVAPAPAEQAPAAPQITAVDSVTDTSAVLTLTGVTAGNTVTAFCERLGDSAGNEDAGTEDTVFGTTTTDQRPGAGFQLVLNGLTANSTFECVVTQTTPGGTSSGTSNEVTFTTNPPAPTLREESVTDTSTVLTVTNFQTGASVTVTCVETSDAAGQNQTVTDTTAVDEDPTRGGFQVRVDGLEPGSSFSCTATQTVGGRTSSQGPAESVTTNSGPTIQSARITQDTGTVGTLTRGDTFTLTFDQSVFAETATITIQDQDGDVAQIQCTAGETFDQQDVPAEPTTDANGDVTAAVCEQTSPTTLVVQLLENADDRNAGIGGDNGIQIPATITAINNATSTTGGRQTDLANSPDRVID